MAKPRSNSELIHRFCNGYRDHVTVSNMSIVDDTIFSYRLPIGRYVGDTLLIHSAGNSNTTNRHIQKLRMSAHGHVIYPEVVSSAAQNRCIVAEMLPAILLSAARARLRRDSYISRASRLMEEANKFLELEGLTNLFDIAKELGQDLSEIAASARAEAKRDRDALKARQAKLLADSAVAIEQWRAGIVNILDYRIVDSVPVLLRLSGDEIQTSRRAAIPKEVAPTLWKMVLRAKAKHNDYKPGLHLGHYTLNRISGAGDITVGCHHIKFDELQRMSVILGLENETA